MNLKKDEIIVKISLFAYDTLSGKNSIFTLKDLCTYLDIERTHPYFNSIYRNFVENGIFKLHKTEGIKLFFSLDKDKLIRLVEELYIIKIVNEEYNPRYRKYHIELSPK